MCFTFFIRFLIAQTYPSKKLPKYLNLDVEKFLGCVFDGIVYSFLLIRYNEIKFVLASNS